MSGLRLLRQRNFALLWTAGLVSMTGDWLLKVALPIYVFQLTHSPAATAGVVAANVGTGLLVGLLAGVYVDRWDRRRVMLHANLLQAVALLPLLAVDDSRRVWIVFPVVTVQAAVGQFVGPAEHALLPRLVPAAELPAANSLNALNNNISRLAGPALGGVVAATAGLAGAALLDAASFALAAALVALITGRHATSADRAAGPASQHTVLPSPDGTSASLGASPVGQDADAGNAPAGSPVRRLGEEIVDGLRVLRRSVVLRALFAVVIVTSVGEGTMGSLFPVFVDRALHGGASELGWLMSAQAVGGLAGGLLGTVTASRVRPSRIVSSGLVIFGVVDLVIFNYPRWFSDLGPEIALFVLVGVPGALMFAGMMTLLQTEVDDVRRGRVFSAAMVAGSAAALAGAALAGTLTEAFGVLNVLTGQGGAYVLAGLVFAALVRHAHPQGRPTVTGDTAPAPSPAPSV